MNDYQKAYILQQLFENQGKSKEVELSILLNFFNLSEIDKVDLKSELLQTFQTGIGKLNQRQYVTLKESNLQSLKTKLDLFEIPQENQDKIIQFFKLLKSSHAETDVDDLEPSFSGIQVATTDDFQQLLLNGYSGEWTIDPTRIKREGIEYLQIASMNHSGSFPRGFYINAKIVRIEESPVREGTYRIYFKDPVIINSGKRNIKFTRVPVRYLGGD